MSEDIFNEIHELITNGPTNKEREIIENVVARAAINATAAPPHVHETRNIIKEPEARRSEKTLDVSQYENDAQNVNVVAPHFTSLQPTTFGLSGTFSGVSFNEEQIIEKVVPKYPCIRAVCNFGDKRAPEFATLLEKGLISLFSDEKSARARAKRQSRAGTRNRKVQGNGTCFNSSILFWIYSDQYHVVYKLRLFRTGQFGLPGTKPNMIRDILSVCEKHLAPILRDVFAHDVAITSIVPIMKDYKWQRELEIGEHLNLREIAQFMLEDTSPPLPISYVDHGCYNDNKLSVKFAAENGKTIRVNIYLSGKIDILGAFETEMTKKICFYIIAILERKESIIAESTIPTSEQLCGLRLSDFPDIDEPSSDSSE